MSLQDASGASVSKMRTMAVTSVLGLNGGLSGMENATDFLISAHGFMINMCN